MTGVDDVPVAERISPSLTTAAFPFTELGREALLLTTLPQATRPRRKMIPRRWWSGSAPRPCPALRRRGPTVAEVLIVSGAGSYVDPCTRSP